MPRKTPSYPVLTPKAEMDALKDELERTSRALELILDEEVEV